MLQFCFSFMTQMADFWALMVLSKAAPWFLSDKRISALASGPGPRSLHEHCQTLTPPALLPSGPSSAGSCPNKHKSLTSRGPMDLAGSSPIMAV